jgi:hypothetical protein
MPDDRRTGLVDRCRAMPGVIRARSAARRARGDERCSLAALGESLVREPVPATSGLEAARTEVAALDAQIVGLRDAVASSLRDDRIDYAAVAGWLHPLVISRGLASRSILRHRLRRLRKIREAACVRLGAAAAAGPEELPGGARRFLEPVREARSRVARATGEAEGLLAPIGGELLPRPVRLLAGEVAAFFHALLREVRAQVVPRAPALLGLVAGWWVTRTFTDSRFLATLHSLGIGSGPRVALDHGTYRFLAWGLPLLAAASCSYLSARLASVVRARYGEDAHASP